MGEGIFFGQYGDAWTQVQLGGSSLETLRRMLDKAIPAIILDNKPTPRLKTFEKCDNNVQLKSRAEEAVEHKQMGGINFESLSRIARSSMATKV